MKKYAKPIEPTLKDIVSEYLDSVHGNTLDPKVYKERIMELLEKAYEVGYSKGYDDGFESADGRKPY